MSQEEADHLFDGSVFSLLSDDLITKILRYTLGAPSLQLFAEELTTDTIPVKFTRPERMRSLFFLPGFQHCRSCSSFLYYANELSREVEFHLQLMPHAGPWCLVGTAKADMLDWLRNNAPAWRKQMESMSQQDLQVILEMQYMYSLCRKEFTVFTFVTDQPVEDRAQWYALHAGESTNKLTYKIKGEQGRRLTVFAGVVLPLTGRLITYDDVVPLKK